jgi:hypothetical protein
MMRIVTALAALFLVGCVEPAGSPDEAIEITGFLDGSRVSWTLVDGRVSAAGQQGAVQAAAELVLSHDGLGTTATASAGEDGAFVVEVAGEQGDAFTLSVVGVDDHTSHTEPARPDFPAHASAVATHLADHQVQVEVAFVEAQGMGHVWASNHARGATQPLEVHEDGLLHIGRVAGDLDDWLVLFWVPAEGAESLGIEVRAE